ncbi:TPA: hypothetical protein ACNAJ6_005467, partial [Klebsiella pneumoniae]
IFEANKKHTWNLGLMLWHERWHRDPAHQWLRQFIVNSLEEQTC